MKRSQRLDYKQLSETGEKVEKEVKEETQKTEEQGEEVAELSKLLRSISISENLQLISRETDMEKEKIDALAIEESTIAEDIIDYIDENEVDDVANIAEIDVKINKIEEFRTSYRKKHKELKLILGTNYGDVYGDDYDRTLGSVKGYIKKANHFKKEIMERKSNADSKIQASKARSRLFLYEEVETTMKDLNAKFNVSFENMNDEDVSIRKNDLPKEVQKLENLTKRIHDILECAESSMEYKVDEIMQGYRKIVKLKESYSQCIDNEMRNREITKQELFNEAKLKINLPKFSGYESNIDIYTFQSEFMKVHKRTTPTRMMPDILKNNLLEGSALSLVRSVTDIKEIWKRLKDAYGDPKLLLKRKIAEIDKINHLSKIRDTGKIVDALSNIINTMKDLEKLANYHDIKSKLYSGDGLEKIYQLLGDNRVTRWLALVCEETYSDEELWLELIKFLEKDLKVQQQKLLIQGKTEEDKKTKSDENRQPRRSHFAGSSNEESRCHFCDNSEDHVATNGPKGTKIVQYFACRKFVEMSPNERFKELRNRGYCFQCLFPGAGENKGKHKDGMCQRDFICKHKSHDRFPRKKHVLVCHEHRNDQENQDTLQLYKDRCITKQQALLPFSKDIKLTFHINQSCKQQEIPSDQEKAIYILQTIKVQEQQYSIFYDTGCSEMVSRHDAIKRIGNRAREELAGPISIGGVGNSHVKTKHGIYQVKLPLYNGNEATLSGVCLDQITVKFPNYPIKGRVEDDIIRGYKVNGRDPRELPKLPKSVGGHTDFMIGIKYLRYYPEKVFQLPSGLSIYRSWFKNADGTRGVIGGPHRVFTEIESTYLMNSATFVSNQYQLFKSGYRVNPDASMLHVKVKKDYMNDFMINENDKLQSKEEQSDAGNSLLVRSQKIFEAVESAGSEISYRCSNCRNCKVCKEHEQYEMMSVKEEIEQDIINNSVTVDMEKRTTTASLPLIHNPVVKLAHNKEKALQIYNQQIKKLNKNPQDKVDVIESEAKLQSLGYVDYVKNLTPRQQEMLRNHEIQNYIPWRAVWNGNSVSTPCRVVYDASQPTPSGVSLNDILAKGKNNMNKLVEIVIRWSKHKVGFHTDIKKMYNTVQLREEDWCLQRYIWQSELDSRKLPEEKIIKTLIYGIKSSGNQAERGLRETAKMSSAEYPCVNKIVQNDVYVDDCLSGEENEQKALEIADRVELVLNRGGFSLKGITFSGKEPPSTLSANNTSINVAGMKWLPKEDIISLDISELNFAKKQRGKKPLQQLNQIPVKLTRRHCVSKVAEIFDLTGRITPITATMKMDLHNLVERHLNWDDVIPDELRPVWDSHFEMMQEIGNLKFKRAIVPDDAINLDINTIDAADASNKLACVAIYARFLRRNGEYSCQLVFSRSKLIPSGLSQPRAELLAATMNTHTGEVVRRAFQSNHKKKVKLTDSQVTLYWICNPDKPLKQWVRNRVVEINRFTEPSEWMFVRSQDMIADLGTRRIDKLELVNQDSIWINGFDWMKEDESCFPTKSMKDIKLSNEEITVLQKENVLKYEITETQESSEVQDCYFTNTVKTNIPVEVHECYKFSNYLLDPDIRSFYTVIRIFAFVLRFIRNSRCRSSTKLQQRHQNSTIPELSDKEINLSKKYFFKKATLEVKMYLKPSQYEQITTEKDEILYYNGRILPTENVTATCEMSDVMKDLSSSTFCVPVIYKHSPLAYSIVNDVHWNSKAAKHSGVETVWRYVLKTAFIISGRELVKRIKIYYERCRYLRKKTIEVEMGPVSKHNITIAPAFYSTQIDLCGPFKAYSQHHKRATIKIWLVVFCCMATSTTIIKVMEELGRNVTSRPST